MYIPGRQDEKGVAMLMRILALLCSFANLAERAATRSRPVRACILGLLRPAEAIARNLVLREAKNVGGSVVDLPDPHCDHAGDDDALHLARCFHVLALALEGIIAWIVAGWLAARGDRRHVSRTPYPDFAACGQSIRSLPFPDTS